MFFSKPRIKRRQIEPNPYFIDINKKELNEKIRSRDVFDELSAYSGGVKRLFSDLPQDHQFWLVTGRSIPNLVEMMHAFSEMSIDVYSHHVNHERNDFARWVRGVYQDSFLADQLDGCKTPESAKALMERYILHLFGQEDDKKTKDGNTLGQRAMPSVLEKLEVQEEELARQIKEKCHDIEKKTAELQMLEKRNQDFDRQLSERYHKLKQAEEEISAKMSELDQKLAQEKIQLESELKQEAADKRQMQEFLTSSPKSHHDILSRIQAELQWLNSSMVELEKSVPGQKGFRSGIRISMPEQSEAIRSVEEDVEQITGDLIEKLLQDIVMSLQKKDYDDAKQMLDKIKVLYSKLNPNSDEKKEFYEKIQTLKNHVFYTMGNAGRQ